MSKIIPKFYGKVENGKLILEDQDAFKTYLCSLNGKVELIVKKYHQKRSNQENRYYWGVIIKMLADEYGSNIDGVTAEEWWHEFLKTTFLKEISFRNINGKSLRCERIRSTAEDSFKTIDAERYYEDIRRWVATELNFYLPEPNELEIQS